MLRGVIVAASLVATFTLGVAPASAQAGGGYYAGGNYGGGYPYGNGYPGSAPPRYGNSGYGYGPGYAYGPGYSSGGCCRGLFGCCNNAYYAPPPQYVAPLTPPPPPPLPVPVYVQPAQCVPQPTADAYGHVILTVRAGCW